MSCVWLVVPCYNEAERLDGPAFARFRLPGHDLHVLFVDDGSTDATAAVLTSLCADEPNLAMLKLERNGGKAEAVRQGVAEALRAEHGADFVGFWDADLATPLEELHRFAAVLERSAEVDMVFGARVRLLGRVIERKTYRHLYGRGFATAVSNVLALNVYDTQCGAKLFRASDDLRVIFGRPFLSRWIFDVEILARLIVQSEPHRDVAERIVELPLREWRHVAGSKIGPADGLKAGWELARIGREYRAVLRARRRRLRGR